MDRFLQSSAQLASDAQLAADVDPARGDPDSEGAILLTGATGYFGSHLLAALLSATDRVIYCPARSTPGRSAAERVAGALRASGSLQASWYRRLRILESDLSHPHLALDSDTYNAIARETATIVHCAANVSWSRSYANLREDNVKPVANVLRLTGVGGPKRFCLISSIAVCYSTDTNQRADEDGDPWRYLSKMPLGYAQSKCVAERLVRQAAARGLHASIVRPALLVGDTSGCAAPADDFVAQLIHGCIRMGYAPDLNWRLDAVPVDYAAAAVARTLQCHERFRTLHISHPHPRSWREVVLFLNLFGYTVRLEPFDRWRQRLAGSVGRDDLPLQRFLGFFTRCPDGSARTISQIYEADGTPRVSSAKSLAELTRHGLQCPRLDARYFDRYLRSLRRAGLLDSPSDRVEQHPRIEVVSKSTLDALRRAPTADGSGDFANLKFAPFAAAHSITSEMASWRHGGPVGLYESVRPGSAPAPGQADLILKIKPLDAEVVATVTHVASACSKTLGRHFERYGDRLDFRGAGRREAHIYESADEVLLPYLPRCHALGQEPTMGRQMILLERLRNAELLDSVDSPQLWSSAHMQAAIGGLADIHAAWYGRERRLFDGGWLAPAMTCDDVLETADLWQALQQHAKPYLIQWGGDRLTQRVAHLLRRGEDWLPLYGLQRRTLIHNDCNPRNLAFRRRASAPTLCIYDWELCTIGAPQRDLAELLCFVLDPDHAARDVWRYVELHRVELSRRSGVYIDPDCWREGFACALADLMLRRLNLYVMLHTFSRQRFLPRVVRCWQALDDVAGVGLRRCARAFDLNLVSMAS